MSYSYNAELTTESSPVSDQDSFTLSSPIATDENTLPLFTPDTTHSKRSDALFSVSRTEQSSTKAFRFQQRARSSSPQAQLGTANALARDRRKSQFLDRVRSRRDEERGTTLDDQVLRMDFVRERKEWEARRAAEQDPLSSDAIEAEEHELQLLAEEAELSPTEEKEIEELLNYLPAEEIPPKYGQAESTDGGGFEQEFDDDEYDRLFEEMDMDLSGMNLSQKSCVADAVAPTLEDHSKDSRRPDQDTEML